MNFHNNNQIKSRTIDNRNEQNTIKIKPNKFSKSQTSLKVPSNELYNKRPHFKNQININDSNSSSVKKNELYDEEINYNIDSTKNVHDTTYYTNLQKEMKKDDSNIFNNDIIDKNYAQREYWLEEKNSYIQELEKKIKKQNNIITGLLNNDSSSKSKITNIYQDKTSNSNTYLDYSYENKKLVKRLGKKEPKNRTFIEEFTSNEYNINETNNSNSYIINKSKIKNNNNYNNKTKDKYDSLYSKYLNLLNDFKYLNNNKTKEKSINKLQNKYNSLLEENKNLKSKLKSKNKLIKNQQEEINELKNQTNSTNEEEKELIKNLREQSETFRKDLVLSQAMVNSLKAEIDSLKKTINSNNIQNSNKKNKNKNRGNNNMDKYNFTFNNNNNYPSAFISPKNNLEQINNDKDYNINTNNYSSNELIVSLNNKNKLLTKVLQENNMLRNRLKKFDSFLPNFIDLNDENEIQEIDKENLIKKYEEKFQYFSFYIKRIKILINDLFKDIPFTLNKYLNKNNSLSEKFILGLYDLRKEYYSIKKIDEFNLDVTDDEKCIKIYTNLIKLLNKELEVFANNNINNKININDNNTTNINSNNISSSNINNYYKYLEKEVKNENDINYINNNNSRKKLNLTDLNTARIEEEKNNLINSINNKNKFESNNQEKNNKVNNRRITYITNYANKNRNKSANINYNREYFFDYGYDSNNNFTFDKEV